MSDQHPDLVGYPCLVCRQPIGDIAPALIVDGGAVHSACARGGPAQIDTFDQAIAEAARRAIGGDPLARWMLEAFGEDMPCGLIPANVHRSGRTWVQISSETPGLYTASDACAFAATIIRAADVARSEGNE